MEIAAGTLGSAAGGAFGNWVAGNDQQPDIGAQVTQLVNNMNGTLNDYMHKAIKQSNQKTNQAIDTQKQGLNTANDQLTQYLQQAQQQAQMNALYGNQQSAAYAAPAMAAGNNALGAYMDSLGLSRPTAGYGALQQAALGQANYGQMVGNLGPAPQAPGQAPVAPQMSDPTDISDADVQHFIKKHIGQNTIPQGGFYSVYNGPGANVNNQNKSARQLMNDPNVYNAALAQMTKNRSHGAETAFNTAMGTYNTQNQAYQSALQQYNAYNSALGNMQQQYAPNNQQQSLLQAYNQGLLG